ncbi:MAG: energy transducer TonB [Acidobacteriaceae bacterium]|nr:energy transducer TonB [Acidobacteriaceae bacterium]
MAKPIRTIDTTPKDMRFATFGILDDGSQSKSSLFTSISLNLVIAFVVIVIGSAAKHSIDNSKKLTAISLEPIKKIDPPKPVIVPKLPPTPVIAKVEPPKIKLPDVKLPDIPKPPEVKMVQQVPIIQPAPPKLVQPPPAPKVVNLARAMPASVVNNSPKPTAVALGQQNNPIAVSNRPATSSINLGNKGMSGMPASNTGTGPAATAVNLGSGSAGSQNMSGRDNAANAVRGVKLGVTGGTGPMNSTGRVAGPVNLGQNVEPAMPKPVAASAGPARTGPKVIFKPRPEYTAEATRLHIEGVVSVRIHVSAAGTVQVLGVTSDLGHGLGESAVRAVQATRFQPAIDTSGHPIDWDGVVNVAFQLAS